MNEKTVTCPECGSQSNWKDGKLKTKHGETQRYYCRNCARRFVAH